MRGHGWLKLCAAVALCGAVAANTAEDPSEWVAQDWDQAQKEQWYTMSQGSRLMPLAWMRALEQPDSQLPFLARSHTERYRYLPGNNSEAAPLPVGFAIDEQRDTKFSEITKLRWRKGQSDHEPWVGLNCAACHSNELSYAGKRLRIEGAPTMADFQGYFKSLNLALVQTRNASDKWDRFAAKVLGNANTADNRRALKAAFATLLNWQLKVQAANATDLEYGYGRLDAFGHIFNKVLLRAADSGQPNNPSDAPVSYPFLWNIHQHDYVQWNGIARNVPLDEWPDIGALGRNVGEVIGVFADLTLLRWGPAYDGYPNSARIANLNVLEKQISLLKPPNWPSAFPAIDADKWSAGEKLFYRGEDSCASCHQVLRRDDLSKPIEAKMARLSGAKAIGTDPWMACNAYTYQGSTGRLFLTPDKFAVGVPHGRNAPVADMLGTTVIGAIYANRDGLIKELRDPRPLLASSNVFDFRRDKNWAATFNVAGLVGVNKRQERLNRCMTDDSRNLAYKGRPLVGAWATPPFLHNGSVPSLYDLLLPPALRPATFMLGTREFDPKRVGYVSEPSVENTFVFRTRDANGLPIDGNSNLGHDYGNASFTEEERWALVEYMKAVGATRVGNRIVP